MLCQWRGVAARGRGSGCIALRRRCCAQSRCRTARLRAAACLPALQRVCVLLAWCDMYGAALLDAPVERRCPKRLHSLRVSCRNQLLRLPSHSAAVESDVCGSTQRRYMCSAGGWGRGLYSAASTAERRNNIRGSTPNVPCRHSAQLKHAGHSSEALCQPYSTTLIDALPTRCFALSATGTSCHLSPIQPASLQIQPATSHRFTGLTRHAV